MAAVASIETDAVHENDLPPHVAQKHASALTPPTSEDLDKHNDASSELSELDLIDEKDEADDDDDIGPIEPDHYYGDGKIPVFKPVRTFDVPGARCTCRRNVSVSRPPCRHARPLGGTGLTASHRLWPSSPALQSSSRRSTHMA